MSFVHLHVHSEYSLGDSVVRIPQLIERTRALDMPAVALTDRANLFGLVRFYRAAQKAGIKPIIGTDIYLGDGRVILLCQNRDGYRNLCRLVTRAYAERVQRKPPALRPEWLAGQSSGLLLLAGRASMVGESIRAGRPEAAEQELRSLQEVFDDRLYVEFARIGAEDEAAFFAQVGEIAARLGVVGLASNEVRFLQPDDFELHEARVAIGAGERLSDPQRTRAYTDKQFLCSPEQMRSLFADAPVLVDNACEIAKRCSLELHFGTYVLPAFPTPEGRSVDAHLEAQARSGLEQRLARFGPAGEVEASAYPERLAHELGVIQQMGFSGYFLIVADFISWAKSARIPVGPGRGSGAGSLVAYALGITELDPLRYALLFERFLNPERVSMPDFDIDFCMERRDEVIEYVAEKYGRNQVSQIITYGRMAARAVVRDSGRVLGQPFGLVDKIAKLISPKPGIKLAEAIEAEPELATRIEEESDTAEIMELALGLEGLARNAGKHAGGVVIAPSDLTDFVPLYCEAGGESMVSQLDKDDVEAIGLVKFDFLGLRTLTILEYAIRAVNEIRKASGSEPLELASIPLDDPETFALMASGRTTAVFQLESRGMKDLIRRLRPESFEEIIALVALFRPGPLDSGMVDQFVEVKHGRRRVTYPHPKLQPILEPTYGVILYQEQVMQCAQVLAGYTLGGADLLRRAMGKKKPAEMARQRSIFVDGATERGLEASQAEAIFDQIETFAGYGFNKSHSAAYALLAYQTAFLKTHYPAPFMAAVLSADMDNTDKLIALLREVRALRIEVLPPSVNHSATRFVATGAHQIRYGLGAIKGVGIGACEEIVAGRSKDAYGDLMDFCLRVGAQGFNRRMLEALILAGALDEMGASRRGMLAALPDVLRAAEQTLQERQAGQNSLFAQSEPIAVAKIDPRELPPDQLLRGEKDALGLYLSGHPLDAHTRRLRRIVSCPLGKLEKRFPHAANGGSRQVALVVAGLIVGVRRRGEQFYVAQLEDNTGRIEVTMFDDGDVDPRSVLLPDTIVIAEGMVREDDFSGGYAMRASRVLPLEEGLSAFAKGLVVEVDSAAFDSDAIEGILRPYRGGKGQVIVCLRTATGKLMLELGEDWQVRPRPDLRQQLAACPGVARVELLY